MSSNGRVSQNGVNERDRAILQRDDVGNHLKGILNGGFGLIQGMGLTLRLSRPINHPVQTSGEDRWKMIAFGQTIP